MMDKGQWAEKMGWFSGVFLVLALLVDASGAAAGSAFTQGEIRRVRDAKALLMDSEKRTVDEIIDDLQATGAPEEQLAVYEAVAATFRDLIETYGENNPQARQSLLAKIQLNMAYFQLGGADTDDPGDGELNRLIRRKLKQYLPAKFWGDPKLFHSLE